MTIMSFMEKKNTVYEVIKEISEKYGGERDEVYTIDHYVEDRISAYRNDMDALLSCFCDLQRQIGYSCVIMVKSDTIIV